MQVDTHIHSSYSRESPPHRCNPRLILRTARRVGLDGICISDHDTIDGYLTAKRIRRDDDPLVIPACEVSTSRGHLLAIGVEESWEKGVDPLDVVDLCREEGGIVAAPHPFYLSTISVSWLARDLELAVEVFNAMASILVYPNLAAEKLASKYGLPRTAGSDAHSYELVGLGRTVADADDEDDFISEVRRGRVEIRGSRPKLGYAVRFALNSLLSRLDRVISGRGT